MNKLVPEEIPPEPEFPSNEIVKEETIWEILWKWGKNQVKRKEPVIGIDIDGEEDTIAAVPVTASYDENGKDTIETYIVYFYSQKLKGNKVHRKVEVDYLEHKYGKQFQPFKRLNIYINCAVQWIQFIIDDKELLKMIKNKDNLHNDWVITRGKS